MRNLFKVNFGKIFAESIRIEKVRHRYHLPAWRGWGIRSTLLYLTLIGAFFALGLRLFHLMVVKGESYRGLSAENRIRTLIIHAPRGIFFDRRGKSLVKNLPAVRIIGPCVDICQPKLHLLDELLREIAPNSFLEKDYLRWYQYPAETAHTLGYLSEINKEELANLYYVYQSYLSGDKLGRSGMEEIFEKTLRGTDGKELIEVDAANLRVRTLGQVEAIPGTDITLAIDLDLQKVAHEAMEDKIGAVVVSKPRTGEILALVSTPAFDPNSLHRGITSEDYQTLTQKSDRPLFNRAVSGVYPPGSTWKPVVALTALEEEKVTTETQIEDTGIVRIGEFEFANWYFTQYGRREGAVDMQKAIARSNDIYFYRMGEIVGVEALSSWGKKMGVGKKSGIELPNEAEGIMPDPTWRQKVRGQKWYLGDTYHLAIGQGEILTTPLQVNLWTSVIAGSGRLCQPTLLKTGGAAANDARLRLGRGTGFAKQNCQDLGIKKDTIEVITQGMYRACANDEGWGYQGTGWPLFDFTITKETLSEEVGKGEIKRVPVACKTGTAEFGDPQGRTHAWFTAFAPLPAAALAKEDAFAKSTISGEPEIVVTVLVEGGGEGSSVAGPIAKKVLAEWFKR